MESYKKAVGAVNVAMLWIAVVTTVTMSAMVVLQVVFRYIIQSSLSFSEELARYMFVWATFTGTAIAYAKRSHVSIEIIVARMAKPIKKVFIVITNVISSVFFILIIVYGIQMILRTVDQTSPALGLRMCYVYAAVPLSGIAMLLNCVRNGYEEFHNPDIIKSEGVE